ncbi:Rieske (2Fe-2S) protein [Cellvibrio polysaccharolyticus]|uniref:Rieske (2Fe-2S) protein n=1 Tax=Cellvibrio polysaccharolyticus TaxID=2082724 RepID=A0A928YTI3_9GAMM|nr:Rieske 2Fe-2S domain-containing protein [Cellvibrio polysaccharolyticus]MBE8716385.1 Rieske (2Fe-2S) protein [Cellvibrio polysaccharolyticus]
MNTPLFYEHELADRESRGFIINHLAIFAVRQYGVIHLYQNRCPHRGISLEWLEHQFLDASGELIQCATHGALFLPESGLCVSGPCRGQSLIPIAFTVIDGGVFPEIQGLGSGPA